MSGPAPGRRDLAAPKAVADARRAALRAPRRDTVVVSAAGGAAAAPGAVTATPARTSPQNATRSAAAPMAPLTGPASSGPATAAICGNCWLGSKESPRAVSQSRRSASGMP